MIDHSESVVRHYSAANLTQKIAAIMSSMLPDDRPLTVKDLARRVFYSRRRRLATRSQPSDLRSSSGTTTPTSPRPGFGSWPQVCRRRVARVWASRWELIFRT
jgi:hypothetical protein